MITSAVRKIRVQDVADGLRREIVQGKLAGDTPLMSTRKIADFYRVSALTANRAVERLVNEGLVYRVKGSGTYVKGSDAPRRGCRFLVGLASEMAFANESLRNYSERPMDYLRSHQAEVQIIPYCDLSNPEVMKREFGHLDGVLLAAASHDEKTESILLGLGCPVVMYQCDYIRDTPFDQVTWDYVPAYRDILQRIEDLEHRRFLFIHESHRNGIFRVEKFIEMLLAAGGKQSNIRRLAVGWRCGSEMGAYKSALDEVKNMQGDLIFSSSDIVSASVLSAFDGAGLKEKRDYELISCDDLEGQGFRPFPHPRMTTVHHPRVEAAETAAKLLLERIRQPSPYTSIIKIATSLVIRDTGLN